MFDVAMQNSWILYNKTGRPKISQLEFGREIVNVYLEKYKNTPTGSGRISKSICSSDSRISDTLRFDKTDHLVQHTEEKKKMCRKKLQLNYTNNVFKMFCWVMH